MKIYAITKGCYSDYHICALTADRDRAERLKKICSDGQGEAQIEEYEDGDIETIELRWHYYSNDDTVKEISNRSVYWDWSELPGLAVNEHEAFVVAPNAEHARKKAQDMIAQYKAEQVGL